MSRRTASPAAQNPVSHLVRPKTPHDVPAGVGAILHIAMLREEWLAISVALVLSTVVTIAATGLFMAGLISAAPQD